MRPRRFNPSAMLHNSTRELFQRYFDALISQAEVAIAWTLRHPAVTAAIVGARNAKRVDGIIGGGTFN
jgi:predicted oxidoreductase